MYQGHDMIPLSLWRRTGEFFCVEIIDDSQRWRQKTNNYHRKIQVSSTSFQTSDSETRRFNSNVHGVLTNKTKQNQTKTIPVSRNPWKSQLRGAFASVWVPCQITCSHSNGVTVRTHTFINVVNVRAILLFLNSISFLLLAFKSVKTLQNVKK